ncbi:hypothetical protein [Aquimarina sp. 2201CG5-10]|uniref:hypothetical protein n=1 Tax=Aquimarina callyspongiae TaxID=3098150 RepID=UPI002AB37A8A|nr:hypothetical protein [Aquimarina sp. 2201CG5-10]MDY8136845.1 hypothetical protein [Aquimarina sp. 2201CG5-10]
MSEKYNLISIQQWIDKISGSDLYPHLLAQLQKDIKRAGIECDIEDELKPVDLVEKLHDLLVRKIQYAFNEYLNLLYAVDVSETEVKNIKSEDVVDITKQVTYLILKREWQKVWYRNNI